MDRALARPRISFAIVQALLGLIFLAWLPAMNHAGAETPFPLQLEKALLLIDWSDSGETERENGPEEWSDGDGTLEAFVSAGVACLVLMNGQGPGAAIDRWQFINFNLLGSLRATGPPSL